MKQRIIDYLIKNANPSIVLRIKKEILKCLFDNEEIELLNKISMHKNVQTVIKSQKIDGWFGNEFHGQSKMKGAGMYDNMEVGLRYLAEKGFPPENKYIKRAVDSFLKRENYDYETYRIKPPPPKTTDYDFTAFALWLLRSSIIIRAGYEFKYPKNDFIDLKHDVNFSLKTFFNVLNYTNTYEALDTHRKKICFKPGVQWPCMYDLRILAHSRGWRIKENYSLLADSINRLFSFPQCGEDVYTFRGGQFYSPCAPFIHTKILCSSIKDENVGAIWFDLMELFARCGIVDHVKELKNEYNSLLALIDEKLNININFSKHKSEIGWSPYGGISLEDDWKDKNRLNYDLLFRVLLIIHYVENAQNDKL